jgi:hypothetical protein
LSGFAQDFNAQEAMTQDEDNQLILDNVVQELDRLQHDNHIARTGDKLELPVTRMGVSTCRLEICYCSYLRPSTMIMW